MTQNSFVGAPTAARPAPRYLTDALNISLVGEDTYCLLGPEVTIGFVQKRDNTFVGLLGEDLFQTVEVGASLSFDECVAIVLRRHRG